MNTFSARPMIESALLAAIGAVLVLLGFYVPIFGILATLMAPLASALAVIRHDLRWGILSSAVTVLVLFPFLGWITALSLWSVFGLTGLAFGWAVKRGLRPPVIVAVTGVAALAGILVGLLEAYVVAGLTPYKLTEQMIESFRIAFEMNKKMFGENPALDQMMTGFEDVNTLMRVLPGALIIAALFQAYLNFEVSRKVLPRLGERVDPLPPFRRWMFPTFVANSWALSLLLGMLGPVRNIDLLLRATETIFSAGSVILMVQALSLVAYYMLNMGFPRLMTGFAMFLVYSLSSVQPFGMVVALSGMIDILFDFRRIRISGGSI